MKEIIKHYWFWIIIAMAVLVLLVVGLQPEPVLAETGKAKIAALEQTIEEEGKTRVIHRYQIHSPVAAYMRRVELDVGDLVEKGQALVNLEPLPSDVLDPRRQAEAKARVASAESALHAAKQKVKAVEADATFARAEFERKNKLQKTNAISKEQFQQTEAQMQRAEAELRSAQFSVEIARHDLEAAKTLLEFSGAKQINGAALEIDSPVDGAILKVIRESEGVVAAGEPLLEVGNPLDLEVVVEVLSADAVKIKTGTLVELKRWGGGTLNARVRRVEPVAFTEISALGVEEQRVLVVVDIHSAPEDWNSLGDGYRVEAEFVLWRKDAVLQIPESALFRVEGGWAVYKFEEGVAKLNEVTIGMRNGLQAEVLAGLAEGDAVVLYPGDRVKDGVELQVR